MNEKRRRVLIVEDEPLVAMLIEDMLVDLGHDIVGPAMRLRTAMAMARDEAIDLAVLDVNVHDETSFPVAAVLRERGIPFVFSTGYGRKGLAEGFEDVPALTKPFDVDSLRDALNQAFQQAAP